MEYYGGEEAYAQQIQLLGISEDTYQDINSVYYLYSRVLQEFCTADSTLYPGDDALQAFAEENNFVTAKLLYISTTGIDSKVGISTLKSTAKDYAKKLQDAKDVDAVYAKLAAELGMEGQYPENGLTLSANDKSLDATLMDAISALKEGEVSDVITCDNGYYVAIRMPLDQDALLNSCFDTQLQEARRNAEVTFNEKLYNSIDTADFYTQLLQQRSQLAQEFSAGADSAPDAGN